METIGKVNKRQLKIDRDYTQLYLQEIMEIFQTMRSIPDHCA